MVSCSIWLICVLCKISFLFGLWNCNPVQAIGNHPAILRDWIRAGLNSPGSDTLGDFLGPFVWYMPSLLFKESFVLWLFRLRGMYPKSILMDVYRPMVVYLVVSIVIFYYNCHTQDEVNRKQHSWVLVRVLLVVTVATPMSLPSQLQWRLSGTRFKHDCHSIIGQAHKDCECECQKSWVQLDDAAGSAKFCWECVEVEALRSLFSSTVLNMK